MILGKKFIQCKPPSDIRMNDGRIFWVIKMKNKNVLPAFMILLVPLFSSCSSNRLGNVLKDVVKDAGVGELSTAEVVSGLKEALIKGASKGSDMLSLRDGFYKSIYKIILPPDAKFVCDKLCLVPGFGKTEEVLVEKINRAAEDAAKKAKPIFISSIQQMTIKDAWNVLRGEDTAATQYLASTTKQSLYNEFKPVIVESLNKFGALDCWSSAVNKYNKFPLVKQVNPDIADYVTDKTLDGLFQRIAEEEKGIRHNLDARTSELLKKVFSKQD